MTAEQTKGQGELLCEREEVHTNLSEQINFLLTKADERDMRIIYQFVHKLIIK